MSEHEPPYDRMPTYEDIFRERGEALNACLVLVGERDRLRTENATLKEKNHVLYEYTEHYETMRAERDTLRELVREALHPEFKWSRTLWRERAEKALTPST